MTKRRRLKDLIRNSPSLNCNTTWKKSVAGPSGASQQLKPLTSFKSKVWRFFGFAVDESGEIGGKTGVHVVCRLCERRVLYSGNTTSLFSHLQMNHPQEHKEVIPKKPTIQLGRKNTAQPDSTQFLDVFPLNEPTSSSQRGIQYARTRWWSSFARIFNLYPL